MSNYNTSDNKFDELISLLNVDKVDRRRRYDLLITSCYFSIDSAETLVSYIDDHISLNKMEIFIDKRTALKIGKRELEEWRNGYYDLKLYTVPHASLFHSKAYALVSYDKNGDINGGSLVVGSANLTGSGITSESGNIESLLSTQCIREISKYTSSLNCINREAVKDLEDVIPADEKSTLNFALLNEGEFIHKWTADFKSYLSVKYTLSAVGMAETKPPALLKRLGFSPEQQTISKLYVDFDPKDYMPPELKHFIKNYGIENHLGYWVPRHVFDKLISSVSGLSEKFGEYIESNLPKIKEEIAQDYEVMIGENMIEKPKIEPEIGFENGVEDLLSDEKKLFRMLFRLERFYLPYDLSDIESIDLLAEEITSMAEGKKKKNIGAKAWLAGINTGLVTDLRNVMEEHGLER